MADRWKPANAFPPGRNAPCFCGSGNRFKRCCGSTAADRRVPHGVGIDDSFLAASECAELVALADTREGERLQVVDVKESSPGETVHRPDEGRVTEWVDVGDEQHRLDNLVARAFRERILPACGQRIDWFEQPHLLRYQPGGFYANHADSDKFDPERNAWQKVLDRDISLLLYLNDDYEGGDLWFPMFDYRLRPRAGMLVWFPSDFRYQHQAESVTSGRRYAIVSWAAQTGVEKVQNQPPKKSIPATDLA